MIVILKGLPDGKWWSYETGFPHFTVTVNVTISEVVEPIVARNDGIKPLNFVPTTRIMTFAFSHRSVDGILIYTPVQ